MPAGDVVILSAVSSAVEEPSPSFFFSPPIPSPPLPQLLLVYYTRTNSNSKNWVRHPTRSYPYPSGGGALNQFTAPIRLTSSMSESDRLKRPATPSAPAEDDVDVDADGTTFRDIHPSPAPPPLRQPSWDVASQRSLSSYSDEQFMASMSREFTAMVDAGGAPTNPGPGDSSNDLQLARIGEHEPALETNPLAIVADTGRQLQRAAAPASASACAADEVVEVRQVKKDEAEAKVAAWQAEEVAKINNKFKREEVVINGWESQQINKATAYLNKIERKLEEERAKATEKAQNEVARARRKAEEKRASAEAVRGTKTAKVMELANFMKAVGRVPTKRSFFSFSS